MLSIIEAKHLHDYQLEILFSDKRQGVVDLTSLIEDERFQIFSVLKEISHFKNFKVDYTIIWSPELDIAPEYLYFKAFEKDPSLQSQFKSWGYEVHQ